ncbi:Hydroxyacylglutathione hydrolase [compost metagenome]
MNNDNRQRGGGELTYPYDDQPGRGELREVAPGVRWISMPLPFDLLAINLWLLDDGPGYTLVDTGFDSAEARDTWESLIAGPMNERPITRVLATHMHADHIGLAGWVTRRFDCRLWMTQLEYLHCRMFAGDTGREIPEGHLDFYRRAGWNEQALELCRKRFGNFGTIISRLPESYRRIRDGERLQIGDDTWEVVIGAGHSPEHACFYNATRKLLITGDQVLPRITSNISVYSFEPDADPVSQWLGTLATLRERIPDDVLVLPAHGNPFHGLHARLTQLESSTQRALQRLRQGLDQARRVVDTFSLLFLQPIPFDDVFELSLATNESRAKLNHLLQRGEIEVHSDRDGIDWYSLR